MPLRSPDPHNHAVHDHTAFEHTAFEHAAFDHAAFDHAAFRRTLGQFATGVAIVAAEAPGGKRVGMTMSSFNSVSLDPPLVLFSVSRKALSLPALKTARSYGISVLARHQEDLSNRFARPLAQKWADVDFTCGQAGAPLITGAAAHMACVPHATHDGGNHVIFIARVLAHGMEAAADPLIFHAGRYRALATGETALLVPNSRGREP